jgi:hypothetical protein
LLKTAQHVYDNRNGFIFVAHTACYTECGLRIGIIERANDDSTAVATERVKRNQISLAGWQSVPPTLANSVFAVDR